MRLVTALLQEMTTDSRAQLLRSFSGTAEVARTVLLHAPVSESTVSAFERDTSRFSVFIGNEPHPARIGPGLTNASEAATFRGVDSGAVGPHRPHRGAARVTEQTTAHPDRSISLRYQRRVTSRVVDA